MDQATLLKLAEKYRNGKCSSEEKEVYEQLLEELTVASTASDLSEETLAAIKADRYGMIMKEIRGRHEESKQAFLYWRYAAAAALLFCVGFVVYFARMTDTSEVLTTLEAKPAQITTYQLPDGTRVTLNAGSTLSYSPAFNQIEREVELTGQAYFEVTNNPEKPFIVKSGQLNTRVLGTIFMVYSYMGEQPFVAVKEGRVSVSTNNDQVVLAANDMALVAGHSLKKQTGVEMENQLAWLDGEIVFEGVTLQQAAKVLSRSYGIEVIVEGELKNCSLEGNYKKEPLRNVLQGFEYLFEGMKIEWVDQQKVVLSGKGC